MTKTRLNRPLLALPLIAGVVILTVSIAERASSDSKKRFCGQAPASFDVIEVKSTAQEHMRKPVGETVSLSPEEEVKLTLNLVADCLGSADEIMLRRVLAQDCILLEENTTGGFPAAVRELARTIGEWEGEVDVEIDKTVAILDKDNAIAECVIEITTAGTEDFQVISRRRGAIALIHSAGMWRVTRADVVRSVLQDIHEYRDRAED